MGAIATFIGLSAVAGGVALMTRPNGAVLQMPMSLLAGSPFRDYFMPGLLWTTIVGGGVLGAALLLFQHCPYALGVAMIAGVALVTFEIFRYLIIGFNLLQVRFGGLGSVVLGLAASGIAGPRSLSGKRVRLAVS